MDILLTHSINELFSIRDIHLIHENTYNVAGTLSSTESHECCEFAFVRTGELIQFAGEAEVRLSAGDIYFIKPGVEHGIKNVSTKGTVLCCCSFKCQGQYMNILNGTKMHVPKELRKYISLMLEEFSASFDVNTCADTYAPVLKENAPLGGQQQFIAYLQTFLIQLLRIKLESETLNIYYDKDNHQAAIVKSVNDILESNIKSGITIDEICNKLAVSRTFLCTLYKKRTGDTIIHRLNVLKMGEAARLMKESKLKLFEIAEVLGFSDQYYFSRLFKRVYGVSPMEYRRENRK